MHLGYGSCFHFRILEIHKPIPIVSSMWLSITCQVITAFNLRKTKTYCELYIKTKSIRK